MTRPRSRVLSRQPPINNMSRSIIPTSDSTYLHIRREKAKRCDREAREREQPLEQLPSHFIQLPGDASRSKEPCLFFGIRVRYEQLHVYALRHRLVPRHHQKFGESKYHDDMPHAAVRHLNRATGANFGLYLLLGYRDQWVLACYDNYDGLPESGDTRREDEVMDYIKKNLNLDDLPAWYFLLSLRDDCDSPAPY